MTLDRIGIDIRILRSGWYAGGLSGLDPTGGRRMRVPSAPAMSRPQERRMTDDELIDAYHGAMSAYDAPEVGRRVEVFIDMLVAERVLIARLGVGQHMGRYQDRYPS
jgi:hypothetical protein